MALSIPINFAVCALSLPKLAFIDQFRLDFAYNPVLRESQWTNRWMGEVNFCSTSRAVD